MRTVHENIFPENPPSHEDSAANSATQLKIMLLECVFNIKLNKH